MTTRRSGAGVGVVDGLLYAVGGHDGPTVRKERTLILYQNKFFLRNLDLKNLKNVQNFKFLVRSVNFGYSWMSFKAFSNCKTDENMSKPNLLSTLLY